MHHTSNKDKNISNYNTFETFEDIYRFDGPGRYDELEIPQEPQVGGGWMKFTLVLATLFAIGFALHPVLSYTLKTPYPLVIIAENSMAPALDTNDLILVKGVVSEQEIAADDVVVFNSASALDGADKAITVRRVVAKNGKAVIVKGDAADASMLTISTNQIIGKALGQDKPVKIPFFGLLGKWLQ